jgi:acetoin utilization deacetylase AcuC-like enzyme
VRTLVLTDPLFLRHQPGPGHPERPERLERILEELSRRPLAGVDQRRPRPATHEELARVHPAAHLLRLGQVKGRSVQLDADTATSPDSWDAAVLAAGAGIQAVESVLSGEADNAFALVRPPGHHAEPQKAMGFCLLNNAAIAAEAARARGLERVLVLDWDVHHGNGTQAAFWNRRDVLYQSVHQAPYYPGTGAVDELGGAGAEGFTVNVPLPGGIGDGDYRAVFEELLIPVAREFRPQLVLVSAGFDPHEDDPIGGMRVTERGFAAMCTQALDLAGEACGGRLVLLLEGGYALGATARSTHACLEVLTGQRRDDFGAEEVSSAGATAIAGAREVQERHWRLG